MVNNDRIVPIQKVDFLSMVGIGLKLAGTSFTVIGAKDVEGNFDVTGSGDAGNKLANQPLQSLDFKSGVTAAVVYFVADYDYVGFKVAGTAVSTAGVTVVADGITLYTATLSGGTVTIAVVTPALS